MNLYSTFNRGLLKQVHAEVKKRFPHIDLRSFLGATNTGRQWIVEGRHARYGIDILWSGRAEDAAHAKYLAWSSFLDREGQP